MSARKRKLGAVLNASTALPVSLQYTPAQQAPIAPTPKKIKTAPRAKPPADVLIESAGLLQLQTDGLLQSLRPRKRDVETSENARKLADSIARHIGSIANTKRMELDDIRKHAKQSGVGIPFQQEPPSDLQLKFEFKPPRISTYTSVAIKHAPASVVIYAEIPSELVQEKDYLNHRIFYKQAFYTYWIATHLPDKYEASFAKDQLVLKRKGALVVLHVVVPAHSFAESKLDDSKNALRNIDGPTPSYNQAVLALQCLASSAQHELVIRDRLASFDDSIWLAARFLSLRDLPIILSHWTWATCRTLDSKHKVPNAPLALFRAALEYLCSLSNASGWDPLHKVRHDEMQRLYLQHELRLALDRLNAAGSEANSVEQAFADIFLRRVATAAHFDATYQVSGQVDCAKLFRVIKRATPGRVSLIHVMQEEQHARVGLLFEDEKLVRSNMVLGPAANTEEAIQFRAFWGPRSELRKFKDGRILETVVFGSDEPMLSLLQHVLHLHMHCPIEQVYQYFDENALAREILLAQQHMAEFEEFARLARDADDLPLRITTISRTTSEYGPHATLEGLIVFESSARWPDHIPAIQRTKTALLLSCQRSFALVPGVVRCQVGLEASQVSLFNGESLSNIAFIQVQVDSGCLYRLRVHFDREYILLENESKKNQPDKARYVAAIHNYRVLYVLPTLQRQSATNVASKHPMFKIAVRLLCKWMSSHLLSRHFTQTLIELLVSHVLTTQNGAFTEPKSASTSFFRVLQFLAQWDWREDCVISTLDQSITQAVRDEVRKRFRHIREMDPGMQSTGLVVFPVYSLASPLSADRVAALRMTQLARASLDLMEQRHANLFDTPLKDFDVLLRLKQGRVFKNLQTAEFINQLFVADLEESFGDTFLVFSGENYSVVGLMLRPELRNLDEHWRFKVNLGFNAMPVSSPDLHHGSMQVKLNLKAVLDEVLRLGQGVITDVDVHLSLDN